MTTAECYQSYGCRLNAIDVVELFSRYETAGFMSMDKLEHLVPHLPEVIQCWRAGMVAASPTMEVLTAEDPATNSWASISCWRMLLKGWQTQHLVSYGDPLGTRAVMLARQKHQGIFLDRTQSEQAWFQPTNRFSGRVFGSVVEGVGADAGVCRTTNFMTLPLSSLDISPSTNVRRWTMRDSALLRDCTNRVHGKVWTKGEELDSDDVELDQLDQLYAQSGMRRYRRVFLAQRAGRSELCGVVIVYRGPIGFNFSFIENRCELIVPDSVQGAELDEVLQSLLASAIPEYRDFAPNCIPVCVPDRCVELMKKAGAKPYRTYSQSIWLAPGYEAMYRHMDHFYDRIARASHRKGLDAGNWQRRSQFVKEAEDGTVAPRSP